MKIFFRTMMVFLLSSSYLFADMSAQEIARRSFSLPESDDQSSRAMMALLDDRGNKRIREIQMYSVETLEGRNSFMEFISPADVAGTRFLTIGFDQGNDEQRIYLPALGRVRRISSSNRGGSFMGSEFSYYDMESHCYEDFTYELEGEETIEGRNYWVLLRFPTDPEAPYSMQRSWINKNNYYAFKHQCFEEEGASEILLKTIYLLNTQKINGIPVTTQMVVENHQSGHSTIFQLQDVRVNSGLSESLFTLQNLTN